MTNIEAYKGGSLGFWVETVVFTNAIGLITRVSACFGDGQRPSSGRGDRK